MVRNVYVHVHVLGPVNEFDKAASFFNSFVDGTGWSKTWSYNGDLLEGSGILDIPSKEDELLKYS